MSPEFLLTAFIVCVSPGIGVVYTLSMTLGGGMHHRKGPVQGTDKTQNHRAVTQQHLLPKFTVVGIPSANHRQ